MSKFTILNNCVCCGSDHISPVISFGLQPLANSYKDAPLDHDNTYPLQLNRCYECFHLQLSVAVDPEEMFKNYLYVSGTTDTMKKHFAWFADWTSNYYDFMTDYIPNSVLDVGCNDGSQLDAYSDLGVLTFGVDPAENLHAISSGKKHQITKGFFNSSFDTTNKLYNMIVAQNVFAHTANPLEFLETAKKVMNAHSLLFIQTSQADMIQNNEFDTIYHEHISYFNIHSMRTLCDRAGLHLIDVIKCPLHGNSYIFVVANHFAYKRRAHIDNLIHMERNLGLYDPDTYKTYNKKCLSLIEDIRKTVDSYDSLGYEIVGYGAAAKGMTLLNVTKINMDYIVDDNPLKVGKFTPGRNIPIVDSSELRKDSNKILLIPLAWNFYPEIVRKFKDHRKDVSGNSDDRYMRYFPKVAVE